MSELPRRLADRAYLVGYDVQKARLRGGNRPQVLNAAVLVDLWLAGAITDQAKRPALAAAPAHREDDVEADVLRRIGESTPRRWKSWVRRDAGSTHRAVRARLSQALVLRVQERRLLGLIDRPMVTVPDPGPVEELVARCRAAALDDVPANAVDPLDAALVALVAAAEWNTVFTGRERRQRRARIAEFTARSGPAVKALRDVVSADSGAAAG